MKLEELKNLFNKQSNTKEISDQLNEIGVNIKLDHLSGSSSSFYASSVMANTKGNHLFILNNAEEAAYFFNDLQYLNPDKKTIYFFPGTNRVPYKEERNENVNIQYRAEVLASVNRKANNLIVSYPEAVSEQVVTQKHLSSNSFEIKKEEEYVLEEIQDQLLDFDFEHVDFVFEPGQFSLRGGILDIFSFSNDHPFRVEFFGDEVDSIRKFDPVSQLSIQKMDFISIVPNVQEKLIQEQRENFFEFLGEQTTIWVIDAHTCLKKIEEFYVKALENFQSQEFQTKVLPPNELYIADKKFRSILDSHSIIEFGLNSNLNNPTNYSFDTKPQPTFNKNFDLLIEDLNKLQAQNFKIVIAASQNKQIERIYSIFEDLEANIKFTPLVLNIHEGFIDKNLKLAVYTDHQIFERYHRFRLKEGFNRTKQAITLKEIYNLQKGDYVVHIDHGVGRFSGLEKMDVNGKTQETIRLEYKGGDILYVNIHSLHRISKYTGKDGTAPTMDKIGSPKWNNLKNKTKSKIKKLAFDLIQVYAKRKARKGFAYNPDTYLQNELEASFIFEDTPDQFKATQDVKKDMENESPMDRLVCGDVGFGKTEVAIRAAFKAATDGKQVAVLVPTTILSLQHFKNFHARLKEFPVTVDYLNRFKSAKKRTETLKNLKEGKIDIIVGTHQLAGKAIKFNDLGLVIIDEEQKFGVNVKDKLKSIKENVDILTLTATPIPRTLQFSLMGARDLSIINTPPPNRQPVETNIIQFNEDAIKEAISYEVSRNGQVYFVHNKVQNIHEVAGMITRLLPGVRVAVGHGQMDGDKLEQTMMDFIDGEYDVLVATTIIESGIDISNANTMIVNNAHNFGLSDLHQLRGRVGRSNKKAFCYLISQKLSNLPSDSRKRLETLAHFSDLGSGFNIAMKDLDIRGAGNLLGGEQSGFISDIGFEMYQKILNEALEELKENEFKDMFEEELAKNHEYIRDCAVETDFELLIPNEYVNNVTERLAIYNQLNDCESQHDLGEFKKNLEDRFGDIPTQTSDLIQSMELKWLAKQIGFEKLVVKGSKMIGYFITNQESPYFQSPYFTKVLNFMQSSPRGVELNEKNGKLRMVLQQVPSIEAALKKLERIVE